MELVKLYPLLKLADYLVVLLPESEGQIRLIGPRRELEKVVLVSAVVADFSGCMQILAAVFDSGKKVPRIVPVLLLARRC